MAVEFYTFVALHQISRQYESVPTLIQIRPSADLATFNSSFIPLSILCSVEYMTSHNCLNFDILIPIPIFYTEILGPLI